VSTPYVYSYADRPDVEVLIGDTWHPGELRAWFPQPDGTWQGNVQYSTGPAENRLDTFPQDQIRQVEPHT
jgi:hypothetical protein